MKYEPFNKEKKEEILKEEIDEIIKKESKNKKKIVMQEPAVSEVVRLRAAIAAAQNSKR